MKKRMSDAARNARNTYIRDWRAKNKSKVKEANLRYWERRAKLNHVTEASTQKGDDKK